MLPRTKGLLAILAWGLLMLLAAAVRAAPAGAQEPPLPAGGGAAPESLAPAAEEPLLRLALRRLREIRDAGGWIPVPAGPPLRPGDRSPRVAALRARLAQNCEWLPADDPAVFDTTLAAAVRRFQRRCGLPDDGVAGSRTLAALNTPVTERIRQVMVNLHRLRRALAEGPPPSRRIEVNIPDYRLRYEVDGRTVLSMPVVVGRPDRPTPELVSAVERLRLNPAWNVPQKLAREDLLPRLRRDPGFASRLRLRVFASWADGAPELDPAAIDWNAVRPERMAYRLSAAPGDRNPLGRILFLFPNPWSVFLHDTSHRELFSRSRRCFSSGCVRVARPLALARAVLAGDPAGDPARLDSLLAGGRTVELPLAEPVPVVITYRTAWVDAGGTLQFREDIYGRDAALWAELQRREPTLALAAPPAGSRDRSPGAVRSGVQVHEVVAPVQAHPARP